MDNLGEQVPAGFIGFVGGILFVLLTIVVVGVPPAVSRPIEEEAYKRGQIDAANGYMLYERVEHNDRTVTWEKISGE